MNRSRRGRRSDGVIIGSSSRLSSPLRAEVAELADAQASGACGRKVVEVQILSSAPFSISDEISADRSAVANQ
jgi:hypothetical protein